MNRRIVVTLVLVSLLLLVTASLAGASPSAPGTPTLRWIPTSNPNVSEIRADGITNGGTAGNGAMNWDIYFRFPATVSAPYPGISITAGPAFLGQTPCGFQTNVSTGQPSGAGGTGDRGVLINGFCASGVPSNPVTGDNVLVATVTFTGCPAQGFTMDLDSGDEVFGAQVADMVDKFNSPYYFTDSDLTDGLACAAAPTAVTMGGFNANSANPTAAATSALPLVLGGAVVAAGGAYAFLRRKR